MLRVGQIYYLDQCQPLDGGASKDRPVVVVKVLEDGSAWVVACTSSSYNGTHSDRVKLPDSSEFAQCRTGLNRPTWAIPSWLLKCSAASLKDDRRIGVLGGAALAQTKIASFKKLVNGEPPLKHQ